MTRFGHEFSIKQLDTPLKDTSSPNVEVSFKLSSTILLGLLALYFLDKLR